MSHPDPNGAPDLTPINVGDSLDNPVTGEYTTALELPWENPEGRASAELNALAGAHVVGTPGERFVHMIETLFGLARLGHTNAKGAPHPLQFALFAGEFSDVIVFRKPPPALQRAIFLALAPIARRRGYRATYPQISRTVLAPRSAASP